MARSLVVLLVALAVSHAVKVPESGYLLTAPKVLQAGTDERVCISLYKLPGPNRVLKFEFFETDVPRSISSTLNKADFLLFDSTTNIPDDVGENGEYCFDVTIPSRIVARRADLHMELTAGGGDYQQQRTWQEEAKVSLKPETFLTLVQTDKAKYQPGQNVLFRVVSLSHDLTPLNNDLSEVWITTPDRIRVAQWKNVSTDTGMVQLEMQLTEEPPLGRWTIHIRTAQDKHTKSFSVEEYVLPTFEVEVETPDTIENNEKTITVKICAKYTFGKPLFGANVTVNVTANGIGRWQYDNNKDLLRNISDYQLSDEKGCAIFDLVVSKLGIGHPGIGGGNTAVITVVVEEEGTGLTQVETKHVRQAYSFVSLTKSDNSQKFLKPKLPYYGEYKLKIRDGKPAKNEIVKVCYTAKYKENDVSSDKKKPTPDDPIYSTTKKYEEHVQNDFGYKPFFWETENPSRRTTGGECREYRTDDDGRIVYYIPPQAEDIDSMDIRTSTSVGGNSDSARSTLTAFFSPSHSYLSIDGHELPEQLPCSGDVTVKLLSTEEGDTPAMVYKIMARGRIIKAGNMNNDTLTFPVLPKMGPEFKLLVYYVKESGEVVSDSRVFKVDKCFPNTVQVSWDNEEVKPGDSASFTVRAAPNSVCGISAVDKSTELLGTSNQITLDTVFNEVQQFIIRSHTSPNQVRNDDEYCKELQSSLVKTLQSGGASVSELTGKAPETTSTDGSAGASQSPHSFRPPSPARFRTDRNDAIKPFDEAGFLVISNLAVETRPCYKRVEAKELPELTEIQPVRVSYSSASTSGAHRFGVAGGSAFAAASSQSYADADVVSPARTSGPPAVQEEQVRKFFPEAILFSIETLDAYGVKTLTSEMPDTITSWVGSAICTNSKDGFGVSNKTSITTIKRFFAKVSLPYSLKRGEVLNMSASVFNFYDSSLSVYLEVQASEQYKIQGEVGYDLCIAAGRTEVKNFPLDFVALGEVNITVSARIKDGNCDQPNTVAPGSDTVIRPIIIKPEGFPQEVTRSRFICLDKGDEKHVEEVELPVPEGLVLDSERAYFSVIGDLLGPTYQGLERGLISSPTGAGEPNMITLVPNIYIRNYFESTGLLTEHQRRQTNHNMKSGYQRQLRFMRSDGSFSSYGRDDDVGSLWLTAFVLKAFQEANEYIEIDENVVNKAKDWILGKQHPNGCFPRVGELIHKELKGGTERGGEAALTAFVMLALKDIATTNQLADGFACLEDGVLLANKTLYSEILIAHTYLKMEHYAKGERLVEKLMKKAKREGDDILYWEGDRTSLFGGSRAVDVEMTAYMVLSLLQISGKDHLEEAARAVRWINTQRNSGGGFVSTQDTIVALEALTQFAIRTFASDLTTTVAVTAGGATVQRSVDATNRLLLQQSKIPDLTLPGSVSFEVSPPGCVVVQSIFRFSSTFEVPDPAFSLGVAAKRRGRTGYELEVCTNFLRGSGVVDRAILEVEMPSGYIPVDSTLRSLRRSRPNPFDAAVRKYESKEGKVVFTLQGVSEEKTCFEFRIIQENEVEQLKPSIVKVHDFYRPEERNIKEYELVPSAAPTAPAAPVIAY